MISVVKTAGLRFVCESPTEVFRAQSLLQKEPGTIAWLDTLTKQDILYDIGASTGIYSLYAARKCHLVYTFEPHLASAAGILRNIHENKLDNIVLITAPLSDYESMTWFNYYGLEAGSTGSQLGHTTSQGDEAFEPKARELKLGVPLDRFYTNIGSPSHIKIDVDGNEVPILQGAIRMLARAKSIQVEVNTYRELYVSDFLLQHGFRLDSTHDTFFGKKARAEGKNPAKIFYNAIYNRFATCE